MARTVRPTILDVAREAGVSPSLVSRVLRGHDGYASPENVAAIRRAAAELAYEPDPVARHLRSGRSPTVGVLFYRLAAYRNYAPVLTGIEDVLRPAGYGQLVASTQGLDDELEAIKRYQNQRVAGVVLISSLVRQRSDHLAPLVRGGLPLVAINRWTEADGDGLAPVAGPLPRVFWDNAGGARALAEHLVGLGHRRLAFMTHRPHPPFADRIGYHQRLDGIRAAAAAAGLPAPVHYEVDDLPAGGWRARGVTAFLGATDDYAAETLHALTGLGVDVPREASLTGFTDTEVASRLTPRLTTARLPFEDSGRIAARLLLRQIDGEAAPAITTAPCPVVGRESCAPPSGAPDGGARTVRVGTAQPTDRRAGRAVAPGRRAGRA
jgi:LacI family transcriptional regulator